MRGLRAVRGTSRLLFCGVLILIRLLSRPECPLATICDYNAAQPDSN
jgi:hypothetical protein